MRTVKLLSLITLVVAAFAATSCSSDTGAAAPGPAAGTPTKNGGVITSEPALAAKPHMLKKQ